MQQHSFGEVLEGIVMGNRDQPGQGELDLPAIAERDPIPCRQSAHRRLAILEDELRASQSRSKAQSRHTQCCINYRLSCVPQRSRQSKALD
eukprot:scaffold275792_cov28-Tisochrysis_lutea.AAC.4